MHLIYHPEIIIIFIFTVIRSWMSETSSRASLVLLHQTHYHDSLKDMKKLHRRKGNNVLAELFMLYQAGDYDNIHVLPSLQLSTGTAVTAAAK